MMTWFSFSPSHRDLGQHWKWKNKDEWPERYSYGKGKSIFVWINPDMGLTVFLFLHYPFLAMHHPTVDNFKLGGLKKATFSCFICDHLTLRAHNIWTVWPILMFKTPIGSVFQGLQWRKKIQSFSKYANGDVAIDSLTRVTEKWTK